MVVEDDVSSIEPTSIAGHPGIASIFREPSPGFPETSFLGRMESRHQERRRYPPELRERAVRMVSEIRHEYGSEWAAIEPVTGKARDR